MSVDKSNGKTEWKVRIASLASFVGTLAVGIALEEINSPEFIDRLPDGLQVLAGAALVAACTWVSGRIARTRPEYISQSTVDAVRARYEKPYA